MFLTFLIEEIKNNMENKISLSIILVNYNTKEVFGGFGAAHNIAIRKSIEGNVKYYLVLHPDIYFEQEVLRELFTYMENNRDLELFMSKVLYSNGEIQYLCKLLATPVDLIFRRSLLFKKFKEKNL
jgi:hypothetical protein